jgi:hypothetical protein
MLTCSIQLHPAPILPIRPMTIKGTIKETTWQPDKFMSAYSIVRNGKKHYASGTLGQDRTIPAHYSIMLVETTVMNEEGADPDYSYDRSMPLSIVINHAENDEFLKKGMRIAVYGCRIS